MYVSVFALTMLRFMVTAFMLLLLVLFVLMLVKEFRQDFPLFKSMAAAMLIALLALNHANSDAWIARYNVSHYQATGRLDLNYFGDLSSGAIPALLELTRSTDPAVAKKAEVLLRDRYDNELADYTSGKWQRLNISQSQARKLLEDHFLLR